jgi:hypothetical protein
MVRILSCHAFHTILIAVCRIYDDWIGSPAVRFCIVLIVGRGHPIEVLASTPCWVIALLHPDALPGAREVLHTGSVASWSTEEHLRVAWVLSAVLTRSTRPQGPSMTWSEDRGVLSARPLTLGLLRPAATGKGILEMKDWFNLNHDAFFISKWKSRYVESNNVKIYT